MKDLICPICREILTAEGKSLRCKSGHCHDIAKQGYVNLLTAQKSGSLIGDNRQMALSRRAFLSTGHFSVLSEGIASYIAEKGKPNPTVTDICCGEGYYGREIQKSVDCNMYGFDISKEMVKLAASANKNATFFVGNISAIPLRDSCADIAIHLFAPFHEKEFSRILKDDGFLISVIPGENHLFEMKEILYDTPYKNDEKAPGTDLLALRERVHLSRKVHLASREEIASLFAMTPYFYHTSDADKAKLNAYDSLDVTVEFVMLVYEKGNFRR